SGSLPSWSTTWDTSTMRRVDLSRSRIPSARDCYPCLRNDCYLCLRNEVLPMSPEWTEKGWRRRPDLNRGSRFCRPLPYHLATAPVGTECREIPAASRRGNNSARNSRSESSSIAANVGLPTEARLLVNASIRACQP